MRVSTQVGGGFGEFLVNFLDVTRVTDVWLVGAQPCDLRKRETSKRRRNRIDAGQGVFRRNPANTAELPQIVTGVTQKSGTAGIRQPTANPAPKPNMQFKPQKPGSAANPKPDTGPRQTGHRGAHRRRSEHSFRHTRHRQRPSSHRTATSTQHQHSRSKPPKPGQQQPRGLRSVLLHYATRGCYNGWYKPTVPRQASGLAGCDSDRLAAPLGHETGPAGVTGPAKHSDQRKRRERPGMGPEGDSDASSQVRGTGIRHAPRSVSTRGHHLSTPPTTRGDGPVSHHRIVVKPAGQPKPDQRYGNPTRLLTCGNGEIGHTPRGITQTQQRRTPGHKHAGQTRFPEWGNCSGIQWSRIRQTAETIRENGSKHTISLNCSDQHKQVSNPPEKYTLSAVTLTQQRVCWQRHGSWQIAI